MIINDALTELATTTAITDQSRLFAILNLAGLEIWSSCDFPDTLEELPFQMTSAIRITLPWFVYVPRHAKGCDKIPIEFNTPRPFYFDSTWYLTPWQWRHLKTTPLIQNINNASPITFSRVKVGSSYENLDINITISGPTDIASRCTETVTLPRGQGSITTTNRFTDLIDCHKDVFNAVDIFGKTADGQLITQIPNHLFQARNTLWQFRDDCYPYIYCCFNQCKCLNVAYKRVFEPWTNEDQPLKDEIFLPLVWKAREIAKINQDADITIFAQKYTNAMQNASNNYSLGKHLRLNGMRNQFTKVYGGHI